MEPHASAQHNNSLQWCGCHHRRWGMQSLWPSVPWASSYEFHAFTRPHWYVNSRYKGSQNRSHSSILLQAEAVFAVLSNPATGCLPGSLSLLFRLWLELSLSHILSGRKIHEAQIRFQEALEPGKLFDQVSVLSHTLCFTCWLGGFSLCHRTVPKTQLISEELLLSLCSSGRHFPFRPSASSGRGEIKSLAGPSQQQCTQLLFWAAGWILWASDCLLSASKRVYDSVFLALS